MIAGGTSNAAPTSRRTSAIRRTRARSVRAIVRDASIPGSRPSCFAVTAEAPVVGALAKARPQRAVLPGSLPLLSPDAVAPEMLAAPRLPAPDSSESPPRTDGPAALGACAEPLVAAVGAGPAVALGEGGLTWAGAADADAAAALGAEPLVAAVDAGPTVGAAAGARGRSGGRASRAS